MRQHRWCQGTSDLCDITKRWIYYWLHSSVPHKCSLCCSLGVFNEDISCLAISVTALTFSSLEHLLYLLLFMCKYRVVKGSLSFSPQSTKSSVRAKPMTACGEPPVSQIGPSRLMAALGTNEANCCLHEEMTLTTAASEVQANWKTGRNNIRVGSGAAG